MTEGVNIFSRPDLTSRIRVFGSRHRPFQDPRTARLDPVRRDQTGVRPPRSTSCSVEIRVMEPVSASVEETGLAGAHLILNQEVRSLPIRRLRNF